MSMMWIGWALTLGSGCATTPLPPPGEVTEVEVVHEESWSLRIDVPNMPLDFRLHLQQDAEGAWTGSLDIPAQGALGLTLTELSRDGEQLSTRVVTAKRQTFWPSLELRLSGDEASGTFTQVGKSLPLVGERVEEEGAEEPESLLPEPPFPYSERSLSLEREEGVTLGGTLVLPEGEGPWPAALLLTGSGAQDRDESLLGHKPFLVLADHLARQGIASLRLDDRGVGESGGARPDLTTLIMADDARAALKKLQEQSEIQDDQVGVIGHSEGGLIAALMSADEAPPAFAVMMAGPGTSGLEVLQAQTRTLHQQSGVPEEKTQAVTEAFARLSEASDEEVPAALQQLVERQLAVMPEVPEGAVEQAIAQAEASLPWMRAFTRLDPREALASTSQPVLAIFGDLDIQVPAAMNAAALDPHLTGSSLSAIQILEGHNHLFQEAETGAVSEYAARTPTPSAIFLDALSDWLLQPGLLSQPAPTESEESQGESAQP